MRQISSKKLFDFPSKEIKRCFIYLILIVLIAIITAFVFLIRNEIKTTNGLISAEEDKSQPTVFINDIPILVEIAKDQNAMSRGLSGRPSLDSNRGMLFVFPNPDLYKFWMPNMKFPIDIIWIDENKQIVAISENLPPLTNLTNPKYYYPPTPVKYVLEVNAGFAKANDIKIQNSEIIFSNINY